MQKSDGTSCLGICYADNHLFYAVHKPGQGNNDIKRIGSIDFNFDISKSLCLGNSNETDTEILIKSIKDIKTEFDVGDIQMLYPAQQECWTIVPRSVYEDTSERETHVEILMKGSDRNNVEISWFQLANTENKLLLLRDKSAVPGISALSQEFGSIQLPSDFEIAQDWQIHTSNRSAFLMVHCAKGLIAITSFIMGNLRGCTYFEYEHIDDLPYLWNLYASHTPWMNGIHDKIFVYGYFAKQVSDLLNPYWGDHGDLSIPDSLSASFVKADEETYGFPLESAFPAIILSLQKETV